VGKGGNEKTEQRQRERVENETSGVLANEKRRSL
jgi:hypothetical protein